VPEGSCSSEAPVGLEHVDVGDDDETRGSLSVFFVHTTSAIHMGSLL
jgi:hypothetical protein